MPSLPSRLVPWLLLIAGGLLAWVSNQPLTDFGDRTIGITTIEGVNAAARNGVYWGLILVTLGMLALLRPWLPRRSTHWPLATEPSIPALLLCLLVCNLGLYLWLQQSLFLNTAGVLLVGALCSRLGQAMPSTHARPLPSDRQWLHLLLCYQLSLSIMLLSGVGGFWVFALIFTLCYLLSHVLLLRTGSDGLDSPLGHGLVMLLLLWPLLWVVARELAYLINVSPWALLVGLALIVMAWARYRAEGDLAQHLPGIYLPALLVANVVLLEYRSEVFNLSDYDYFHLGEAVVPLQQWFQFGKLPFIDFYPIHGFFDILPQLFYKLLKPEALTESLVWGQGYMMGWLPRAAAILLLFHFLSRLLTPLTAFLLLFFLPSYHLVHPYYTPLLLPVILLMSPATQARRWWLALSLGMLVLWRADFGVAAIAAYLGVVILIGVRQGWRLAGRELLPLSAIATIGFMLFALLALWRDRAIGELLLQIINYLSIQTVVASWPALMETLSISALVQYLGFPLLGTLILILSTQEQTDQRWRQVLAFLAIACLVLSMRSLHRHSLYVGYFNAYLYLPLLLIALFYLRRLSANALPAATAVVLSLSFLLLPERQDVFNRVYYSFGVEREYPAISGNFPANSMALFSPLPPAPRLSELPDPPLPVLLQRSLTSQQSFYDFTNSPLLYGLSERPLPGYIMETIYQSSDTTQKYMLREMEDLLARGQLPLVVLRQGNAWDHKDGVANEIRSYRMAEFVFANYRPCLQFERYELWTESATDFCSQLQMLASKLHAQRQDFDLLPLANTITPQSLRFGHLPWLWANGDQRWQTALAAARELKLDAEGRITLPAQPVAAAYLLLNISADQAGELQLVWGETEASLALRPGSHDYLLRLGIWQAWWREPQRKLSLEGTGHINSINLLDAD